MGLEYVVADFTMVLDTTVRVEGKEAEQVIRLMEKLEDLDGDEVLKLMTTRLYIERG